MITIREYFLIITLLLALAATVYLFIGRGLVSVVQQPFIELRARR